MLQPYIESTTVLSDTHVSFDVEHKFEQEDRNVRAEQTYRLTTTQE